MNTTLAIVTPCMDWPLICLITDISFSLSGMALPSRTGISFSKSPFSGSAWIFTDPMVTVSSRIPLSLDSVGEDFPENYTLKDLVPDDLHGAARDEIVAQKWVERIVDSRNAKVLAMSKIPQQHSHLIKGNHWVLPDVTVTKCGLGILIIEVVSSDNYKDTFAHVIIGCIEMLRTWHAHNDCVDECSGFVVPNSRYTCCAMEVKVKFEPFSFLYWMDYVCKSEVEEKIRNKVSQWQFECNTRDLVDYFIIRLQQEECNLVDDGAIQVSSPSSIILKSGSFFWKYNRSASTLFRDNTGMLKVLAKQGQRLFQYALFPCHEKSVSRCRFFRLDALEKPLTRAEAKTCLLPLLDGLHCALTELHQADIAHLDVHLPNIGFRTGPEVTLIDLDRCDDAENMCKMGVAFHHVSDTYKGKYFTNRNADMKSVGMMICYILDPDITPQDYHTMVSQNKIAMQFRQDNFIKTLLEHGEWDEELYTAFKDKYSTLNGPIPRN